MQTVAGQDLVAVGLPDGERGFRAQIDFALDNTCRVDFNGKQVQGWQVRTLWIDNSNNDESVYVTLSASGQTVKIRAGYQAYIPCLQNQAEFIEIFSAASTDKIQITFLERYRSPATWASSAEAAGIIIDGLNYLADNVDNVAPVATDFFLAVLNRNTVYDESAGNWDRMRGTDDGIWVQGAQANGGAIAGAGSPVLIAGSEGTNVRTLLTDSAGRLFVNVNGTVTVSISGTPIVIGNKTPADGVTTPTDAIDARTFLEAFNGTTFDRLRVNSAANISATTQPYALQTDIPGQWVQNHEPATGVQATTTRVAGGAGVRHVANLLHWALFNAGGAGGLFQGAIRLRDGASGVGTVLFSMLCSVQGAVSQGDKETVPRLNIYGSANTAMTLEFGGGLANYLQVVTLAGHSVV